MAGMDGLLCTEVPSDEDDEWRMLDGFITYKWGCRGCPLRLRNWRCSPRFAVEFEFAKLGGSRLAELPCIILHADEFKLRSFAAKPCNKRNEWHEMERSIVRWPRGR